MPTTLGKPYDLKWRGRVPHMLKPDIPVWYRFLDNYAPKFHLLFYDVLLGGPELTPEEERDPMKRMWRYNLAKRADAIATTDKEVWIIEVADKPGLRALGQLQTYRSLWIEDPKIPLPEKMILVCEAIDPDLKRAAEMNGITVYVV